MKKNNLSVANLWNFCIELLYGYDSSYVDNLVKFFKEKKVKRILDSACGIGFPSLELEGNGFEVVRSDRSSLMLDYARKRAKKMNLSVSFQKISWQDLDKKFNEEFDCVLCRGNSLVYIDSWGKNKLDVKKAKESLKEALKNFYNILRPGGVCYIDTISRSEFEQLNGVVCERFPKRKFNGKEYSLVWIVKQDLKKKVRSWQPQLLEWNGSSIINRDYFYMKSYLLQHSELVSLLKEAGFSKVEKYANIAGENFYDVFLAYK